MSGMPVGFRPAAFWNASTAALVPGPKAPSAPALEEAGCVQTLLHAAHGVAVEADRILASPIFTRSAAALIRCGTSSVRIRSLTTSSIGASGFCLQTLKVNSASSVGRLPGQDVEGVRVERVEAAEIALEPGAGRACTPPSWSRRSRRSACTAAGPAHRPGNGSCAVGGLGRHRRRQRQGHAQEERAPHAPVSPPRLPGRRRARRRPSVYIE